MKKKAAIAGLLICMAVIVALAIGPPKPRIGTPERAADSMLRLLRKGDFASAFARVPAAGMTVQTVGRERKYRLWWWWIAQRQETDDRIEIEYQVLRGWLPMPSPVFVTVVKMNDHWEVAAFDAAY